MICPRCGSFIDAGEPYCPDCGYMDDGDDDSTLSIGCDEYDREEVEEALREYGYDLDDLDAGMIDDDLLEEILEDLDCVS